MPNSQIPHLELTPKEDEFSKQINRTNIEKLENQLINFFSSWVFLLLHIVVFVLWLLADLHYDLLTFWVSLEAILLSILILIRSKIEQRSDRQRAIKDYKIDLSVAKKVKELEKEIREMKEMIRQQS